MKRFLRLSSVLLVLFVLSCASVGPGNQMAVARTELRNSFSNTELIEILRHEGYGDVEAVTPQAIKFKASGLTYLLINNKDGDLQLYIGLGGMGNDLSDVNEWNRTHRLSRAYIDKKGDPILESDLLSDAGLTPQHVVAFVRVFTMGVPIWGRFLRDRMNLRSTKAEEAKGG